MGERFGWNGGLWAKPEEVKPGCQEGELAALPPPFCLSALVWAWGVCNHKSEEAVLRLYRPWLSIPIPSTCYLFSD